MYHSSFFIFIIAVFGFLTQSFIVHAEGIGISVEPFLSDLVFEEGETEKPFTVTLSNNSSVETRFGVFAVDFGSLDTSAGVAFLGAARDIERSYEKAEWISLETDMVTLPAGETRELHGKLVNTPDLSPGGHYGAILFSAKGADALQVGPANIAIDQRISALVFLKKRGGERYGMELSGFKPRSDLFGLTRSADFSFKNTGNVHIVPRGRIDLVDPWGRLVRKGIVNEDSSIILPASERLFSTSLRTVTEAWIPGRYTLRFAYRYDGKEENEMLQESIFIFPPLSVASLAGIFVLGGGVLIWRKYRRARPMKSDI